MLFLGISGTASAQRPEAEIEHLIKAATHLEQAGYDQMAADVRQLAAGHDELLKQRLLEAKRAQIAELQAELEQLQLSLRPPDAGPKVVLRLKVLQLSMGKLREFGLDLVSIRQLLNSESPSSLLDDRGDIVQFLQLLETQGFAEVVAKPTLVTTDGRPASFRIGDTKPADPDASLVGGDSNTALRRAAHGTRFECTPTVISGGKIRLKVVFGDTTQRQLVDADSEDAGPELTQAESGQPDLSGNKGETSLQFDPAETLIDVAPGQTLILAGQVSVPVAGATQATLVLVQAEVVEES